MTTGALRTAAISLAVCGDPVICRALVLILRSPAYDVRHVPVASMGDPGALAGVQVVLLAPERDSERRRAILGLVEAAIGADKVHLLELNSTFEDNPELCGEHTWSDSSISWPCSTEELKRHIRAVLVGSPTTGMIDHSGRWEE
jgi:hypothetical protein